MAGKKPTIWLFEFRTPGAIAKGLQASAGDGANAFIVCRGEAERTGTEIAGRRSSDRSFIEFGSVPTTAVFPTSPKEVSSLTKARRAKIRAW